MEIMIYKQGSWKIEKQPLPEPPSDTYTVEPVEMIADVSLLDPAQLEAIEERAAIMEYDGGLGRSQAEAEALRLILARKTQH